MEKYVKTLLILLIIVLSTENLSTGAPHTKTGTGVSVELVEHTLYSISSNGRSGIIDKDVMQYQYISNNFGLHLIYTKIAWGRPTTYYTEYLNDRWSKPVRVGGAYASIAMREDDIFISSSINHHPFVVFNIGHGWSWQKLDDGFSTITKVYAGQKIMVAWRENKSLYISLFNGHRFSNTILIAREIAPIRDIHISDRKITVKEESTDGWFYLAYKTYDYHHWYLTSEKFVKKMHLNDTFKVTLQKDVAEWTFIWYLDEDNSLDGYGYNGDMKEAISGFKKSAEGLVNIIVLDDRSGDGDTRLYYLNDTGAYDISTQASSWLLSEMDMGNPQTLIDFVNWTVHNYPAKHYFVDLWDHGGDYSGAMWDDTNNSHLTLADLRTAALGIHKEIGRDIDIWGYDACLMDAGADDYQIKQAVDIIVASEHTEGGDGWDYNALISNLTGNPQQTPEQYAYNFVEHVDDETDHQSVVTMVALNVTKWDFWFMQAYNELAQAIRQKAGDENSNIKNAFTNAVSADNTYWSSGKDVADFASQLLNYVSDSKIRYWAQRVLENASAAVINYYDVDTNGRKKIMAETDSTSEVDTSFYIFKETEWDEMLNQVYNLGTNDNNQEPICNITQPYFGKGVLYNSTVQIKGIAEDPDGTVQGVEVKVDRGDWIPATGTSSWSYLLNVSNLTLGRHYIFARSYDGDLYSLYAYTIVNVVPTLNLPDLTIQNGDIVLSNSTPKRGDTINITATVYNVGNNDSYNVNVSFYVDRIDPADLIETVDYGNIPKGGNATRTVQFNTSDYSGTHKIIVYVDSTRSIQELNEDNNTACSYIYVRAPPSPPGNLVGLGGNATITLKWDEPINNGSGNIIEYKIYRGNHPGNESYIGSTSPDNLKYVDRNVINGKTYYYYVTAVNEYGESSPSNEVNVTPATYPWPPQNFTLKRGDGFVVLKWDKPKSDGGSPILGYRVYRNDEVVAIVNDTFYNDTELNVRNNYTYFVTAYNAVGESDRSALRTVGWNKPGKIVDLRYVIRNSKAYLTWNLSDSGGTRVWYHIYIRNGDRWELVENTSWANITINLPYTILGEQLSVKVVPVNAVGEGDAGYISIPTPVMWWFWLVVTMVTVISAVVIVWIFIKGRKTDINSISSH